MNENFGSGSYGYKYKRQLDQQILLYLIQNLDQIYQL